MSSDPAHGEQAERCRRSRCCVCIFLGRRERTRVVGHHEPPISRDHATRPRAELDRDTIPLCEDHHVERHDSGVISFWSHYLVDWQGVREAMRRPGVLWDEWSSVPY